MSPSAHDGEGFRSNGELTDTGLDFVDGEFALFEVLLHEFFVGFGNVFDEGCAVFFRTLLQVSRNVDCL
ncbi:hypothetical protein, partial [Brevibacterium paucivorans]